MEDKDSFLKESLATFTAESPFEPPPDTHNKAISQNTNWIIKNSNLSTSWKILNGNVDLVHNPDVIITNMDIDDGEKAEPYQDFFNIIHKILDFNLVDSLIVVAPQRISKELKYLFGAPFLEKFQIIYKFIGKQESDRKRRKIEVSSDPVFKKSISDRFTRILFFDLLDSNVRDYLSDMRDYIYTQKGEDLQKLLHNFTSNVRFIGVSEDHQNLVNNGRMKMDLGIPTFNLELPVLLKELVSIVGFYNGTFVDQREDNHETTVTLDHIKDDHFSCYSYVNHRNKDSWINEDGVDPYVFQNTTFSIQRVHDNTALSKAIMNVDTRNMRLFQFKTLPLTAQRMMTFSGKCYIRPTNYNESYVEMMLEKSNVRFVIHGVGISLVFDTTKTRPAKLMAKLGGVHARNVILGGFIKHRFDDKMFKADITGKKFGLEDFNNYEVEFVFFKSNEHYQKEDLARFQSLSQLTTKDFVDFEETDYMFPFKFKFAQWLDYSEKKKELFSNENKSYNNLWFISDTPNEFFGVTCQPGSVIMPQTAMNQVEYFEDYDYECFPQSHGSYTNDFSQRMIAYAHGFSSNIFMNGYRLVKDVYQPSQNKKNRIRLYSVDRVTYYMNYMMNNVVREGKVSQQLTTSAMRKFPIRNFGFKKLFPYLEKTKAGKYSFVSFEDIECFDRVKPIIEKFDIQLNGEEQNLFRYLQIQSEKVKYDPRHLFVIDKVWQEQLRRIRYIDFNEDQFKIQLESRMVFPVNKVWNIVTQYIRPMSRPELQRHLEQQVSDNNYCRSVLLFTPSGKEVRSVIKFKTVEQAKLYDGMSYDKEVKVELSDEELEKALMNFDQKFNSCFDATYRSENFTRKKKKWEKKFMKKTKGTRKKINKKPKKNPFNEKHMTSLVIEFRAMFKKKLIRKVYEDSDHNYYTTRMKLQTMKT